MSRNLENTIQSDNTVQQCDSFTELVELGSTVSSDQLSSFSESFLVDHPTLREPFTFKTEETDARSRAALRNHTSLPTVFPPKQTVLLDSSNLEDDDEPDPLVEFEDSTYRSLLRIFSKLGVGALRAIIAAMLERSMAVPLYLFSDAGVPTKSSLQAISLTAWGGVNIASDTSLARVLVISPHSTPKYERLSGKFLMNCFNLESVVAKTEPFPVCEIGLGRIVTKDEHQVDVERGQAIVIHMVGCDTDEVFIRNVQNVVQMHDIDIVIYETMLTVRSAERRRQRIMTEVLTPRAPIDLIIVSKADIGLTAFDSDLWPRQLCCSGDNEDGCLRIKEFLLGVTKSATKAPLTSKIKDNYISESIHCLKQQIDGFDSPLNSRQTFYFQQALCEIFRKERESIRAISQDARARTEREITELRQGTLSRRIPQRPFFTLFCRILEEPDCTKRSLLFSMFQQFIDTRNVSDFNHHRPRYNILRDKRSKSTLTPNEHAELLILMDEESRLVLGMEYLWREAAAMYSMGESSISARLPDLAARHLLDGFNVEFVDGEVCQINGEWFGAVMKSLEKMVPGAKVFCMSVIGVESSGKSTLLNTMFGCRLRTSILRCTRGINMQLVRCEDREFDYVLLLDVEGVRSNNMLRTPQRYLHDNRLCTIAHWFSDATIVMMNSGAQMRDMAGILSMVREATNRTNVAYWKDPFFVQRGIGNRETQIEEFKTQLQEVLIRERVYTDEHVSFDYTALPDNSDSKLAVDCGAKVKRLREHIYSACAGKNVYASWSQLRQKAERVRRGLLGIEKVFDHENMERKIRRDEADKAFHAWRVDVEATFADCVYVELSASLTPIFSALGVERDGPTMLEYLGIGRDSSISREQREDKQKDLKLRWSQEIANTHSISQAISLAIVDVLISDQFQQHTGSSREPVLSEGEASKAADLFVECRTRVEVLKKREEFDACGVYDQEGTPFNEDFRSRRDVFLRECLSRFQNLARQMMVARKFHNEKFELAVAQIISEINVLYESGDGKRLKKTKWRKEFQRIFDAIIGRVEESRVDVEALVNAWFREKMVSLPLGSAPRSSFVEDPVAYVTKVSIWVYNKTMHGPKEAWEAWVGKRKVKIADMIQRSCALIPPALSPKMCSIEETQRFYAVAAAAIEQFDSEHRSEKLTVSERDVVLVPLKEAMIRYQSGCHELWEQNNHPVPKLKKEEPALWAIFQNIFEGKNALERATERIVAVINGLLISAPTKYAVRKTFDHITRVIIDKSRNIYLSATMFQAAADLHLLGCSDALLKEYLKNPAKHYADVLDDCLKKSIERVVVVEQISTEVLDTVLRALNTAAEGVKSKIDTEKFTHERIRPNPSSPAPKVVTGCMTTFFTQFNTIMSGAGFDEISYALTEADKELFGSLDDVALRNPQEYPFKDLVARIVTDTTAASSAKSATTVAVLSTSDIRAGHQLAEPTMPANLDLSPAANQLGSSIAAAGMRLALPVSPAAAVAIANDPPAPASCLHDTNAGAGGASNSSPSDVKPPTGGTGAILTIPTFSMADAIKSLRTKLIEDRDVSDFRLRCSECCPRCGIQCNHPMGRGHEGLHHSCHQPGALREVKFAKTHFMGYESCILSVQKGQAILFDEGTEKEKSVPYSTFNAAYPTWQDLDPSSRTTSVPLIVREYLCHHKRDLLLEMYPPMVANPEFDRVVYNQPQHKLELLHEDLTTRLNLNLA